MLCRLCGQEPAPRPYQRTHHGSKTLDPSIAHPARSLASIALVSLLSLILVPKTFSQSPELRASITAFRDSLGAVSDLTALQELRARARANRAGLAGRLRLGCILHRLGELTRQRQPPHH